MTEQSTTKEDLSKKVVHQECKIKECMVKAFLEETGLSMKDVELHSQGTFDGTGFRWWLQKRKIDDQTVCILGVLEWFEVVEPGLVYAPSLCLILYGLGDLPIEKELLHWRRGSLLGLAKNPRNCRTN